MHTKQTLKDIFSKNIVNITFKKVDGTERTMKCTLDPAFLPVQTNKDSTKKKAENENVLPVWNLEENAFRSFRVDSLIGYEVLSILH